MEMRATFWDLPRQHTSILSLIALLLLIVGNWLFHPLAAGPTEQATPLAHWVGIAGSALVLLSQIYSLKKRTRLIRVGTNKNWLDAHILLGLVGAVLVELHSGPVFYGVSGLSRLAMWLVVMSGFAGRYLYSLIPVALGDEARIAASLTDEKNFLDHDIEQILQRRLAAVQHTKDAARLTDLSQRRPSRSGPGAFSSWTALRETARFYSTHLADLAKTQREVQRLYRAEQTTVSTLYARLFQRISLERRAAWLLVSDEAIRIWRLFHIPPCLFLLCVTMMHVWTVLYY